MTIEKGVDPREIPLPESHEHLKNQGVKAVKWGPFAYLEGGLYKIEISKEIRTKINNEESVVISITAPPGMGKTYFGMRYAQSLDPKFHITDAPPLPESEDHGQVVFGREHLSYLTGPNTPLKRGQVILLDESHFGVGARSWQNRDQQALVNYMASIRVKGFVLILVVLHTRMIDMILRDFVVNYEFHMTRRGEARCYRRFFPQFSNKVFKRYIGLMELPLPDEEGCNYLSCLKCKHLRAEGDEKCLTIRAIYERRKEWFLSTQTIKEEEAMPKKRTHIDIAMALEEHKHNIPRRGETVFRAKLPVFILETLDYKISKHASTVIAGLVEEAPWWVEMLEKGKQPISTPTPP